MYDMSRCILLSCINNYDDDNNNEEEKEEEEEEEEEEKVATSGWVAGRSKGYHEVSRIFGKPEIVFPIGKGNL